MTKAVYINDIASFLPNNPVSNDEIENILGMVDGRKSRSRRIVLKNNGIKTRYYAIDPATGAFTHNNARMVSEAIHKLMDKSGISTGDIDCLSCGTSSPDQIQPAHGHMVQGELQLPPCEVVTTAGVCISGMSAMKYVYMSITSGLSNCAVATGSEFVSSCMKASNFETEREEQVKALKNNSALAFEKDFLRWMLSDGAAAALITDQPNSEGLSLSIDWIDNISYSGELPVCMYAGGIKKNDGTFQGMREVDDPYVILKKHYLSLKQDARTLEEYIMPKSADALKRICEKRNFDVNSITWFLPHYSSQFFRSRLYDSLVDKGVGIGYDKWFTNMQRIGNVGSASMYLILEELFYSNKLKKGDTLLCYVPESARFSICYMHVTVV
ncbi:MAG: beta-ketoacyl-ACP synthase III [Deltaproteobacteria bacterium]|nr:beta-ketoacyl-ACP synthase III [Deltaproteobacteria bacterium]